MWNLLSQLSRPQARQKTPEAWFATPAGRHLASLEDACLAELWDEFYGYYAVQLGTPCRDYLASSPIGMRLRVGRSRRCDVHADVRSLPFQSSSLDLVLIAHALEFTTHPEVVVRESYRVLRPEGQIVVLCFNPVGLYGWRRRWDFSGQYPLHGDFIFQRRLRDWFSVLGMTCRHGRFLDFAPSGLGADRDWLREGFEHAGERWWPMLGGVYMMQAIKRVPAIRRIKPAWKEEVEKAGQTASAVERRNDLA